MKKHISKILLAALIFSPAVCFAQVMINEIFYSPQSKAWIEVFNNTDSEVDLSTYKVLGSGASVNGHSINPPAVLPAHSYAVIGTSGAISNFGSVSWLLFQSALKPNTDGDIIVLKDSAKNEIDRKEFSVSDGADGDGNSLQWSGSGWITAAPTPGSANEITNSADNTGTQGEVLGAATSAGASSSGGTSYVSSQDKKLEVSAGSDRAISPGSPLWFQAMIKKNTASGPVEFSWSFGDGHVGSGSLVSHTYKYPGDYAVVLNARAGDIFAVSRLKVKVADASVRIEDKGEYLEIHNESGSELNLFNWKIESQGKGFVFQPDTIVLPRSSLKLDKSLLKMKGYDNSPGLVLKDSMGKEVFAVAPKPEVNMEEAAKNLAYIKNEVNQIKTKVALVSNMKPALQVIRQKTGMEVSATSIEAAMPTLSPATTTENKEDVLYEAPKPESLFSKLTNLVKRVFSR